LGVAAVVRRLVDSRSLPARGEKRGVHPVRLRCVFPGGALFAERIRRASIDVGGARRGLRRRLVRFRQSVRQRLLSRCGDGGRRRAAADIGISVRQRVCRVFDRAVSGRHGRAAVFAQPLGDFGSGVDDRAGVDFVFADAVARGAGRVSGRRAARAAFLPFCAAGGVSGVYGARSSRCGADFGENDRPRAGDAEADYGQSVRRAGAEADFPLPDHRSAAVAEMAAVDRLFGGGRGGRDVLPGADRSGSGGAGEKVERQGVGAVRLAGGGGRRRHGRTVGAAQGVGDGRMVAGAAADAAGKYQFPAAQCAGARDVLRGFVQTVSGLPDHRQGRRRLGGYVRAISEQSVYEPAGAQFLSAVSERDGAGRPARAAGADGLDLCSVRPRIRFGGVRSFGRVDGGIKRTLNRRA